MGNEISFAIQHVLDGIHALTLRHDNESKQSQRVNYVQSRLVVKGYTDNQAYSALKVI